jgi:molecular chaperone GrpE (heat shock protein)
MWAPLLPGEESSALPLRLGSLNRRQPELETNPILLSLFKRLFGVGAEEKSLALRIEADARKLSSLPLIPETGGRELPVILESVSLLLRQLVAQLLQREQEAVLDEPAAELNPAIRALESPERVPTTGLSATAAELIRLRDWILLEKTAQDAPSALLEGMYLRLGRVLEKEAVTAMEDQGPFDEERHRVIATRPTKDPAQGDLICEMVRPGYFLAGQLLRPQEVIIYTYDQDD